MGLEERIGCSTLTFRELQLGAALDKIRQHNFRLANITIVLPSFCPHFDPMTASESDIGGLKSTLQECRLMPISLDIYPGYFNSGDPCNVKDSVERTIDVANKIGASYVTVPSGSPIDATAWTENVNRIKPYMVELADYAEEKNVCLTIEAPHLGSLTENIEQTVAFFERINDRRIGCTLDTSHVTVRKESSLVNALKRIGADRIKIIHLRDSLGEDISITPGKGQADFVPFINELKKLAFKGYLMFELENEGYSTQQKEKELRFAYSYIQNIIKHSNVSFTQKIMTMEFYRFMERIVRNPKAEIKRHKKLHNLARRIKGDLYLFAPIKTYEGIWKRRWHIRRDKVVENHPRSIILETNPQKLVKVGIMGCGYAGATMHGPGFRRLNNVQIVGVIDIDKTKAFRTAKKFKCNYYTDLDEMVEREKPDLVSVCTREWQHYEPTLMLLNSGVDVFCEKIMASRFRHGLEMVEAAQKNGRVLGLNYNYRFMPGIQKIKEIIQSGSLGKLAFIDIRVHAFSYHHALDLICFLGGKIKSVSAYYHNDNSIRKLGGTDWSQYDKDILYVPSINLSATFELENNALATINSSYYLNYLGFILSLDTVFEKGAVSLTGLNMFDTSGMLSYTGKVKTRDFVWNHKKNVYAKGYEYTFNESIKSFVKAYSRGEQPESSGEDGLRIMALEKAVCKSSTDNLKIYFNGSTRYE